MLDTSDGRRAKREPDLADQIGARATRKLNAQRAGDRGVWFGLGMMGLVGWSVALPTLIGAAVGKWLDTSHPSKHGWTLALLVAGLGVGCLNAWYWVAKEGRSMHENEGDDDA